MLSSRCVWGGKVPTPTPARPHSLTALSRRRLVKRIRYIILGVRSRFQEVVKPESSPGPTVPLIPIIRSGT